ncbi:GNAT family N-acetyltransferase [Streptacidiphilus sp. P02-A3a]|uniref:GNAT family N-acetyltransferase n=1 Tax=Streptacidiphilus sp. P02-A3a TaxID=2704468 RepID=UPI0015FE359E|nr:GNAT family protein [Streptacidiphilus sp. P02-A3a]
MLGDLIEVQDLAFRLLESGIGGILTCKGLGTETLRLGLALAFEDLELHRVWAARAPLNTASDKTLLAAGFQREGVIREHVHIRGAWRDSPVYGILESERIADR